MAFRLPQSASPWLCIKISPSSGRSVLHFSPPHNCHLPRRITTRLQSTTTPNKAAMPSSATTTKSRILLVGTGAIGTMAAYALEKGGKASVTAVLRSSFSVVDKQGFTIKSIEHGDVTGWKPTSSRSSLTELFFAFVFRWHVTYQLTLQSSTRFPTSPTSHQSLSTSWWSLPRM